MSSPARRGPLQWTVAVPLLGLLLLALSWPKTEQPLLLALVAVVLVGAVLAAVHHAEVVAHRVGEPFGSLVLAVAVTVCGRALPAKVPPCLARASPPVFP